MFEFKSESTISLSIKCWEFDTLLFACCRALEADGSIALIIAPFSKMLGDSISELLFVSWTIFSPP